LDYGITARVLRSPPAWEAGLRDGDRLLEGDYQPIDNVSPTAWATLSQTKDGATVHLVAQRGNSAPRRLDIVLKAWKEQF
jgi:C-terminal processing protease CtpA/Prc